MKEILGIDVGSVFVGVARANTEIKIPKPVGVFKRLKNHAEGKILEIISENQIKCLVVGLPLSENGEESKQCEDVRNFIRRIKKRVDINIEYQDEYASSVEAKEILDITGKFKQTKRLDAIAACIILESYFKNE